MYCRVHGLPRAKIALLQQVRDDESELEVNEEMKAHFDEHEKTNLSNLVKERDRIEDWLERNDL